jgi:hypothetical protein
MQLAASGPASGPTSGPAAGPAAGPGPSYGGPTSTGSVPKSNPTLEEALAAAAKNKYLKYKNKYLSLKRNL